MVSSEYGTDLVGSSDLCLDQTATALGGSLMTLLC